MFGLVDLSQGLSFSFSSGEESGGEKKAVVLAPYLDVLTSFRTAVRSHAIQGHPASDILSECDKVAIIHEILPSFFSEVSLSFLICTFAHTSLAQSQLRDTSLPPLGVRLMDDGSFPYAIVDPHQVRRGDYVFVCMSACVDFVVNMFVKGDSVLDILFVCV